MTIRRQSSVCHWVETTIDSIVTLSKDNFRHACISIYNLRASLSSATLLSRGCRVDQSERYVARSRSREWAPFRSLQEDIAYSHRGPTDITSWLITSSRSFAIFLSFLTYMLHFVIIDRTIVPKQPKHLKKNLDLYLYPAKGI